VYGVEVRGRLDWMLFLTMASAWALNYPLSKIALSYADPFQLTFLRFAVALPFLAALMPRSLRPLRGIRNNLLVALFGALDLLVASVLCFMGGRYTTPSVASIIIYTYPVLITAMGSAVLGERMGRSSGCCRRRFSSGGWWRSRSIRSNRSAAIIVPAMIHI
jgi:drug/metabolite transporter (DMT)-like permease